MTMQRIDPLGLVKSSANTPQRKAETARQNNTQVGACPVCNVDMQVITAGQVQAYVCMEHAVCLPTQDA